VLYRGGFLILLPDGSMGAQEGPAGPNQGDFTESMVSRSNQFFVFKST